MQNENQRCKIRNEEKTHKCEIINAFNLTPRNKKSASYRKHI